MPRSRMPTVKKPKKPGKLSPTKERLCHRCYGILAPEDGDTIHTGGRGCSRFHPEELED